MPVAEDIADLLTTGGLSSTVHIGELRARPGPAVVVVATPGLPTMRSFNGPALDRLRIQVRARATDYQTADALMTSAHGILDGTKDVTLNGTLYHWIASVQTPYYLEEDGEGRPIFAVNYDVLRSAST